MSIIQPRDNSKVCLMGEQNIQKHADEATQQAFVKSLLKEVVALEAMLEHPLRRGCNLESSIRKAQPFVNVVAWAG